jgi:hypothetical protein
MLGHGKHFFLDAGNCAIFIANSEWYFAMNVVNGHLPSVLLLGLR